MYRPASQSRPALPDALVWALVASLWVHGGLFAVSVAQAQFAPPPPVTPERQVEVSRIDGSVDAPSAVLPPTPVAEPDVDTYVRTLEHNVDISAADAISDHNVSSKRTQTMSGMEGTQAGGSPPPPGAVNAGTTDLELPSAQVATRGLAGDIDGEAHRVNLLEDPDPVASFQMSMGWDEGSQARSPRQGRGTSGTSAGDQTNYQPAARDTPLGRYMADIDRRIAAEWAVRELPIDRRAIGIQGTVAVRYRITRSGRTERVRLGRSSGDADLDWLALKAIPRRLPRIPGSLNRSFIDHQVVLTYDNPFLVRRP